MTLTTAVHGPLLLLERDLSAVPCYGVGVYAMHSHDPDGDFRDIDIEKIGGPERVDIADDFLADWLASIQPLPPCYHGFAVHFERGDMTFLLACLREGITIIVERALHQPKARCFIVTPDRIMVGPCVDVANALHYVIGNSPPPPPPKRALPPLVLDIAEKLGLDPDKFEGIFIVNGGSE